jgi:hypothetical protein
VQHSEEVAKLNKYEIMCKKIRTVHINVLLGRVHVLIVAVQRNKYWKLRVCVCSRSYPTCKARAPCCNLWPAWRYNIFPHYLINGTFKTVIAQKMCVLTFYTTFVWNISHIKKHLAIYRVSINSFPDYKHILQVITERLPCIIIKVLRIN